MTSNSTTAFFLSLAVVLAAARVIGILCRRIHQPPVVGEILAGVALGAIPFVREEFPGQQQALLAAVAAVGLAAFMFVMGFELDFAELWRRRGRPITIALGSVGIPLIAGALLALPLAGRHGPGSSAVFVAFVAVAMSVTALPVLARILADTGLDGTDSGRLAFAVAAVGDAAAWIALAAVAAGAGAAAGSHGWRMAFLLVYLVVLVFVIRPLLRRMMAAPDGETRSWHDASATLPVIALLLAMSCAATEWMGLHFAFGAFAFGVAFPRAGLVREPQAVTGQFSAVADLLMPIYFVLAGYSVVLQSIDGTAALILIAVLFVAIASKTGGGYLGARLAGIDHGEARTIAILCSIPAASPRSSSSPSDCNSRSSTRRSTPSCWSWRW
ncbi:cation:proton antiporter [Nocardia crassostreae]|uniref:cation:proton antiporter n=1 Tax=Nocardia crassostreae TaxID=53428 RepID=UPI000A909CFA|nr:cation:proton antiporter [Nocardia crassostreae]